MKKKCIIKVVTGIGNQGQLPWLATLVTKVTTMVTTMVTMMVTRMVTTMVTMMVTITNLGYRGCVTDQYDITAMRDQSIIGIFRQFRQLYTI